MAKKRVDGRNQNVPHGSLDNRANQLNPNNDAYWKSRGSAQKPDEKNKVTSKKRK
ncbi:MAG: hypothetical protein OXU36_06790 [Candidatus Poribacteria bacterium]|nr:hypothetical protein [Candidatus Poribacteria bacterium]